MSERDLQPKREDFIVHSFCGQQARGNQHRIQVQQGALGEHGQIQSPIDGANDPTSNTESIQVLVQCDPDNDNRALVQFSYNGQSIQRCGSGNIATAFALSEKYPALNITQLVGAKETVTLLRDGVYYGYQTQVPPLRTWQAPAALASCLGAGLKEVYISGGDADYLVAVVDSIETLKRLQPQFDRIAAITQRAIIVTAACTSSEYDYALRYFAPQWGNNEDSATGSGNAVAAPYWARRLGKTELRGYQASASGGEMLLQVIPPWDAVEPQTISVNIFGHCREALELKQPA